MTLPPLLEQEKEEQNEKYDTPRRQKTPARPRSRKSSPGLRLSPRRVWPQAAPPRPRPSTLPGAALVPQLEAQAPLATIPGGLPVGQGGEDELSKLFVFRNIAWADRGQSGAEFLKHTMAGKVRFCCKVSERQRWSASLMSMMLLVTADWNRMLAVEMVESGRPTTAPTQSRRLKGWRSNLTQTNWPGSSEMRLKMRKYCTSCTWSRRNGCGWPNCSDGVLNAD